MLTLQTTRFTVRTPPVVRRMLALLLIFMVCHGAGPASGQTETEPQLPEPPQLTAFRPLTRLPWSPAARGLPLALEEAALKQIFREPNLFVRYAVLSSYLRRLRLEDMGRAFNLCVDFEGTQTPDRLVPYFIRIWAERDPRGCWERVKPMFELVALDEGWLAFDSWGNPRMEIHHLEKVRGSKFWLRSDSLLTFPLGVERSKLGPPERVELLRDFALTWFKVFESWPGAPEQHLGYRSLETWPDTASAFEVPVGRLEDEAGNIQSAKDAPFYEIGVRRRLEAEPARGLEIVSEIEGKLWIDAGTNADPAFPSVVSQKPSMEFLQLWAELDMPALLKWAESLPPEKKALALSAKGLLMSRVDAKVRSRWLLEASKSAEETALLLGHWARWDLPAAWKVVLATKDWDLLLEVGENAVFGERYEPDNVRHARARNFAKVDVGTLPADARDAMLRKTCVYAMEGWGDINIGETARYGLDVLMKTGDVPRDILMGVFKGGDNYGDVARGDGDVMDRTFCSLRVWAALRPAEMKTWLAMMKDDEMREALTWLLENPWGHE